MDGIRRGETGLAGSEQVAGNGRVSLARTDRVGVPAQPAVFVAVAAMVSGVVHLAARRSGEAAPAAEAETLSTLAGDVLRREAALPALLDRVGQTFALTSVGLLEQGPEVADGAGGHRFGRRSAQPQGSAAGRRSSASGMAPGRRLRPGTSACPTSTESSRHRAAAGAPASGWRQTPIPALGDRRRARRSPGPRRWHVTLEPGPRSSRLGARRPAHPSRRASPPGPDPAPLDVGQANGASTDPGISADGSTTALFSVATSLVAVDTIGFLDVFTKVR